MTTRDVESEAEAVLSEIDSHPCSGSDVPREVSREFWDYIIDGLRVRLAALADGDSEEG